MFSLTYKLVFYRKTQSSITV